MHQLGFYLSLENHLEVRPLLVGFDWLMLWPTSWTRHHQTRNYSKVHIKATNEPCTLGVAESQLLKEWLGRVEDILPRTFFSDNDILGVRIEALNAKYYPSCTPGGCHTHQQTHSTPQAAINIAY